MRKIALFAAAAAVALALAGCSGSSASPTASAVPCTPTAAGANSAAVQVTGALDALPTTTFTAPMTTTATERTVNFVGTGTEVAVGSIATVDFTLYNGTSGAQLFTTTDAEIGAQAVTVDATQFLPGIVKAVSCATVGSRIVAVVPPSDAWGTNGNTTLGVAASDTVVFVIDVKDDQPAPVSTATSSPSATLDPNMPTKATGVDQPAPAGFPTVALAADGTPTVTIPSTPQPTALQIGLLKKGDGKTVADGDSVTVQYQGVIWSTGKVFDESWGKSPATFGTGQVIKGFSAALVGSTVGSQVIVVIPPDQGYGSAGNSSAGISGTDDLVFVVDILATAAS
ncbi:MULTISPECIES: FKBP-type peptidyl-prolyl cis-trans isomerase [Subtercola]|uniref:peptidylprolyl isomerase n=1 Tax=Subtercola vilae TaxID=2056433 RepID=A0A4T2C3V5_9MICO|nr:MULTISPECIES: FKBP-type peptidyl-prolyl cis-trans isomerase [Subtercola]MEA9985707.1 FKBP-type peptidyl-prolyl cis-trans isomerase [Subtercola sp. RTI3]TIH37116.1 peptidylprolyl isomerase [Subtercola vilae]